MELYTKGDFHWYKIRQDLAREYEHRHVGEPKKYPCIVSSNWRDDPNGPYTYYHEFKYGQFVENICSACGHVEKEWRWNEEYE